MCFNYCLVFVFVIVVVLLFVLGVGDVVVGCVVFVKCVSCYVVGFLVCVGFGL